MGDKVRVRMLFDAGSPFSYLAFAIVDRYITIWNLDLQLWPIQTFAVLKATGNQLPSAGAKGKYTRADLARSATVANVELTGMPSNFLTATWNTLPALRLLTATAMHFGANSPEMRALTGAIFRSFFVQHGSKNCIIDGSLLQEACRSAGLDSESTELLFSLASTDRVKQALKSKTAEAIEEGAFGVPNFVVDGPPTLPKSQRLFFGADRFEHMAAVIGKTWMGPCPPLLQAKL